MGYKAGRPTITANGRRAQWSRAGLAPIRAECRYFTRSEHRPPGVRNLSSAAGITFGAICFGGGGGGGGGGFGCGAVVDWSAVMCPSQRRHPAIIIFMVGPLGLMSALKSAHESAGVTGASLSPLAS